jgi:uncharacterized protein
VLDLRELGRRPGSMQTVSSREPAPNDLAIEVIGVPPGAELELDLRLESVVEGVLVSGTVRALANGECARCLEPLEHALTADIQELYAYPGHDPEEPWAVVRGDAIDLEPAIRDAVVLALPLAPLCQPDCPGLCVICGARLLDDPEHGHDQLDPRWAGLAALEIGEPTAEQGSTNGHVRT